MKYYLVFVFLMKPVHRVIGLFNMHLGSVVWCFKEICARSGILKIKRKSNQMASSVINQLNYEIVKWMSIDGTI